MKMYTRLRQLFFPDSSITDFSGQRSSVRCSESIALMFTILFLISSFLHAQPLSWGTTGPGGGGALYSPSFSPQSSSELFVACDMTELFHTTNLGARWSIVDFRELQSGQYCRVGFTNNPSIVYAIDFSTVQLFDLRRPSKSTDGGVTWTPLANDPTSEDAYYLFSDITNANNLIVSDYNTMYFSSNGGTSFSQKYQTSDNVSGLHVGGAFFDGQMIFAGTNKGLLVSTDGGSSFTVSSITGIPSDQYIVSFLGAKQNGVTRLYCVTAFQVYAGITGRDYLAYQSIYTLDWGASNWVQRTNGVASGHYPFFIAMAENNINTCYIAGGSNAGNPIMYKTTNGGTSWQNVFLTSNNQNIFTGWSGTNGDRDWSYGEYALGLAVAPLDANKACMTDLGFAHVTTNGGTTWQQTYVNPGDQNPMNAPTPKGKPYHSVGFENTSCWWLLWADAQNMFASFSDIRGARSTDAGVTWSFNFTGQPYNATYQEIKHPSNGTIYIATSSVHDMYQSTYLMDSKIDGGTGRALFSSDKGANWQTLHDFAHPVIGLAIDPTNTNRMYASVIHSTQGGIFVSGNIQNGAASTWTKLTNPPRTQGHPFNVFVLNDGSIVCTYSGRRTSSGFTNSSGVFLSTNGGTSWIDRSDPGMLYWTKDILIDPNDASQNTWYVSVFSGWGGAPNGLGGLYRTTNKGVSWTKISNADRVNSCTISPNSSDRMYFTTESDGLWVTNNLTSSNPSFVQVTDYPFRHPMRVFYNPYDTKFVWVTSFGNGMKFGDDLFVPVELSSFTASRLDDGVQLSWQTATETNNYGFNVERSVTSLDPQWETIAFVAGGGTTTTAQSYSFVDRDVKANGKYSYRLKQIDADGTSEYSHAVEVDFSSAADFELMQNYPNPFSDRTIITFRISVRQWQIQFPNDEEANSKQQFDPPATDDNSKSAITLKVFDLLSREVTTLANGEIQAGEHSIAFDAKNLKSGVYLYRLQSGRFVQTKLMTIVQ